MHSIDYRLANALQARRLDDGARLAAEGQDSQRADLRRQSWPARQLQPWLYGLGGCLVALGHRLEAKQILALEAGQEQRR